MRLGFQSNLSGSRVNPKDTAIPWGASDEWAKKLDDKERLFVEGYLQTLNKRQAARYAGYTDESAARYAYEIFNRPHVREAIKLCLRNRTGITKPWIVDKLAAIIDLMTREEFHNNVSVGTICGLHDCAAWWP